jgi:hypothetical protein
MAHRFPGGKVPHLVFCEVHKKKTFTKENAKKLLRVLPHREGTSRYRCTVVDRGWHVGHLPEAVRRGDVTRHEVYRDAA